MHRYKSKTTNMSRRLPLLIFVVAAASVLWAAPSFASTYYVNSSGSDTAAGTSQSNAWRTVGRVNSAALQPGDTVLFAGGATFADTTLMPSRSGSSSAPITFGSYGSGRATIANTQGAVWFAGKSWLVFDGLRLTTNGSNIGVFAGSDSAPSSHITLSDSVVTNTNAMGIAMPHADSAWTITGSTITQTGDSGLILLGSSVEVTRSTISDTGLNAAITYGKHGIYSKGPNQTISYNDISNARDGEAISVRFHGARVFGNTLHDLQYAIGFYDYDTAAPPQGTSYIYGNRGWNISGYAFYYDGQLDPNGKQPSVDFVFASNTFQMANAPEAINVAPSGSATVTIVNNVFLGTYGSGLRKASTTVANHNLWSGGTSNIPSAVSDLRMSPSLTSSPDFAPSPGSAVVDAGTASGVGLTYANSCDGTVLSYCGSAPDLGAVETAVVGAVPLSPPSGLVAASVSQTGLTLSWSASGDPRVSGYTVLRNGAVVATSALPIATIGGLTCGTAYTFSVRATGSAATSADATTSATTAACSSQPAPNAPAVPAAAGGGGGTPPELAVAMSFGPQPAVTGDQFDYAVSLYNNSIQGSDKTVLTVNLPKSVQYVGSKTNRGSGCAASGQTVTCNLDWFPGKFGDTVRISVKVMTADDLSASASVWSMPADANTANDTARVSVKLAAGAPAATPGGTTLGNYSTPPVSPGTTATATVRTLQTAPRTGATVKPRFLVVAKAPTNVKAVAFVLDGRSACVDRALPFTCALKARPGWHNVRVRPIGGSATTVRLRVAG
jgi:hypothetical protein